MPNPPKTRQQQILIVEPAVHNPEIETFNKMSVTSSLPCSYHLPAMLGMSSLHAISQSEIAGIVIGGSRANVEDGLPWQEPLNNWLKKQMALKVPILGICYGHQLIGHLFGGKISKLDKKQSGFREITIHRENRLGLKDHNVLMIVSHEEYVVDCPRDFNVLASSELLASEGFSHKDLPIWTLQPHPEATLEFCLNNRIKIDNFDFTGGYHTVDRFFHYCAHRSATSMFI